MAALAETTADALVKAWSEARTDALDRAAMERDRARAPWRESAHIRDASRAYLAAHTAWLCGEAARADRGAR